MSVDVLQQALTQTREQQALYPRWRTLDGIAAQLKYLLALESGTALDAGRLNDITLGVLAIRELDDQSPAYAKYIHAAAAEARRMQAEHRPR